MREEVGYAVKQVSDEEHSDHYSQHKTSINLFFEGTKIAIKLGFLLPPKLLYTGNICPKQAIYWNNYTIFKYSPIEIQSLAL